MDNHTREHICYARNLNYVLPAYVELLSNWRFYGNLFTDLYTVTFQTFDSDILPSDARFIVNKYGFMQLADILNSERELTEIAEQACKSVCDPIPEPEPEPIPTPNPCGDEECPICKKCIHPTKPSCEKCVCTCNETKCPICNKCFVLGVENLKCKYCKGDEKNLHLLQDSILRMCPNLLTIFVVKDRFLSVRPFYKWESAELATTVIKISDFGRKVYSAVTCTYDFRESAGASLAGNLLALPTALLVNRNTNRLAATFLHELFHTKQIMNPEAKANAEIEAKLAKLIFAEQAGISESDANQDVAKFYNKLKILRAYIDKNGDVIGKNEDAFNKLFREISEELFAEKTSYTYDKNITGIQSIQILKTYL